MSLKQEIETWVLALMHYDNQQYDEALQVFDGIADTSKIFFNCGVIYATLGEHEQAVECYQRAVSLDQYLAVAYFQEGVSNFLLGDFEEALANFNDTLLYLRGNTSIDYDQLGLRFRLFSCEVLFNRGLCYIYLQHLGPGLQDLEYAAKEKVTPDHDVINDALRERAAGYTVFSIPVGVIYRPNEAKVKNLKTKDYLGKARLVAAYDKSNSPTGFGGAADANRITPPAIEPKALEDRSPESISYGAMNLVQKNLNSRSRQHSEPPLNRNMFPPTPPPDADKASSSSSTGSLGGPAMTGRSASVRAARPPRLDLERPGANIAGRTDADVGNKPRIGTTRTASESRAQPSRQQQQQQQQQQQSQPQGLYIQNAQLGYWEPTGHRRGHSDTGYPPVMDDEYTEDVYGMYPPARRSLVMSNKSRRPPIPRQQQPQQYIDEEEEYASDACDEEEANAFLDNGGFEIMDASRQRRTRSPAARVSRRGHHSRRQPEICKFRIKVHASEDTRYIMVGPTVKLAEFETKIRDKFEFVSPLKMKMQDDGDMVTMVDQEDLDLLLITAKEYARREGSEMGKMEIWVEQRTMI